MRQKWTFVVILSGEMVLVNDVGLIGLYLQLVSSNGSKVLTRLYKRLKDLTSVVQMCCIICSWC